MKKTERNSNLALVAVSALCLGVSTVGCGGGAGGTNSSTGPSQTAKIGPVAVSFTGHPAAAITASSSTVTAVGQAGASYTTLSMNPTHALSSTYIAFSRYTGLGALYTVPAVGAGIETPLLTAGGAQFASISQSGVMAFALDTISTFSIDTMLSDGSQQKVVVPGVFAFPAISPNGATIAYVDFSGNVWTVPSGGGTPTKIYAAANAVQSPPVWSPSGTQLAFTVNTGSSSNVYVMSSTGTGATNVTPPSFASGDLVVTSWSPNGAYVLCYYKASGAANFGIAYITPSVTPGPGNVLSPSSFSDSCPAYSPDGLRIAFYRSNAGGASPGIYVSDSNFANPQMLVPDPSAAGVSAPVISIFWSPFQGGQTFVGAHGTITASPINGFLVTQNASAFASLLTFTATTASTATLTQSGTNSMGAPMAFTLGADSITNISFANVYSGTHSSIPLTGTSTAVVTIDATTGFVDYVVPAIAGKAHPTVSQSHGGSLTYSGSFSGIYDGTGKNLAPGGATTLEIDRTTGKLVSFK